MRIVTKMATDRDSKLSQMMTGLRVMTSLLAEKATTQGPVQIAIVIRQMTNSIEGYAINIDRVRVREERGLFKEYYSVVGMGSQMHIVLADLSPRH